MAIEGLNAEYAAPKSRGRAREIVLFAQPISTLVARKYFPVYTLSFRTRPLALVKSKSVIVVAANIAGRRYSMRKAYAACCPQGRRG